MRPKKRLFLGFLLAGILAVGGLGALLWYVIFRDPGGFYRQFLIAIALILFIVVVLTLGGLTGIVSSLLTGKNPLFLRKPSQIVITHLLPFVIRLGKLFRIAKERVEQSFIEVNNALVKAQIRRKVKPEQVLILAPHCLQLSDCPHRITGDINNCQRCGCCGVDNLLTLAEDYGVRVAVVTGGTLARRVVASFRPRAIVAIACERDLTSGIQDIHPLPTLGVINLRPEGPCLNTQVDPKRVRDGIEFFLGHKGQ